ncbi:MAG TPA: glycosyltransferase family 4 protein [Tepidisphaeraceae bacterium]|nr:glycosyltransferase family 4 protein [Tepidisphaeraceae bacterium]
MPSPIRLLIQQASLAKYRVPVFRELAQRPGIQLKLLYAQLPALPNATPSGFDAQYMPMRRWQFHGHPIYWHSAQWDYATRQHADVLLLAWDVHYASLIPALLRARANNVATIVWGHGYSKTETPFRSFLRRTVAKLATAVLFYSNRVANTFLQAGWDPHRIYVARNALDQAPIQQARQAWLSDPQRLHAFQQQHGLLDSPVILFVSRLDGERRAEMLVSAAARLRPQHPRLRLVVIGEGPDRQKLEHLARNEGLADQIHFTGPLYDEQQLAPWFLSSTIFCFPANIGLSLLHAFGYGLPVVTSDRIANHGPEIEALRDGENGLLYRDGSVEDLAATLGRLLADPTRARRLGEEAYRTATEHYSLPRMVDGIEAAIRYCVTTVGIDAQPNAGQT